MIEAVALQIFRQIDCPVLAYRFKIYLKKGMVWVKWLILEYITVVVNGLMYVAFHKIMEPVRNPSEVDICWFVILFR